LTNTVGITFANASSYGIDPATGNNFDAVTTTLRCPRADLQIRKERVGGGDVVAGDPVTYTITITNAGPDRVDAVAIDTFTAGAVASIQVPPECNGGEPVMCSFDDLSGTQTMTLVLNTSPHFSGTLINTASITAAHFAVDSETDNNQSSHQVIVLGGSPAQQELFLPLILKEE
jgi:hypothetical protein